MVKKYMVKPYLPYSSFDFWDLFLNFKGFYFLNFIVIDDLFRWAFNKPLEVS